MKIHSFYLTANRCFYWLCTLVLALSLSACGGGGSGSTSSDLAVSDDAEEQTQLMVSLTDAEGDFLSYVVSVNSISFMRSTGGVVEVLTEETTVDFAQYVDISELLAVRSVPVGRYDSVSLDVDFSEAQIIVQSESGEAIEATLVDDEGAPMEEATIEVNFGDDDGFTLRPRVISHVTLDFDLDASNEIAIEGSEAVVNVAPIWVADTEQDDSKPLRLRGALAEVSVDENQFEIALRPFRTQASRFGQATVMVDADTSYEVDGEVVENAEGLTTLASLEEGTPVITMGVWDRETREYTATEVLAGSSVPWAQADILRGTVIARSGNEVSVRGALLELGDGRFTFNDDLTLLVGDNTVVNKRGEEEADISDISVGSAIRVTGAMADDDTMDASDGVVRVGLSSISGIAVTSDPLTVDLRFVNGRRASLFDFAGTGTSAEQDADPANYEVDAGDFDTASIFEESPVRLRGFVSDFGSAPADFEAVTLTDASDVKSVLVLNFGVQGSDDALSVDENGLTLNLENVRGVLSRAGIRTDLSELDSVLVEPDMEGHGIFSLTSGRSAEVFSNYEDFVEAVSEALEQGASVLRFSAQGEFDSVAGTFTSKRLQVHLNLNETEAM